MLLGCQYECAIDIWSMGCIVREQASHPVHCSPIARGCSPIKRAQNGCVCVLTQVGELFLGLPIFPGESEYNQLAR